MEENMPKQYMILLRIFIFSGGKTTFGLLFSLSKEKIINFQTLHMQTFKDLRFPFFSPYTKMKRE